MLVTSFWIMHRMKMRGVNQGSQPGIQIRMMGHRRSVDGEFSFAFYDYLGYRSNDDDEGE
jgi:hypothetical protein